MALILILFIICLFNYTDISRVSPSNLTLREGSHGQFTCLSKYPPDWYYSESEYCNGMQWWIKVVLYMS